MLSLLRLSSGVSGNEPMYCLDEYQYQLPEELIAHVPAQRRDDSRLLVLNRTTGSMAHRKVAGLEHYLAAGDVDNFLADLVNICVTQRGEVPPGSFTGRVVELGGSNAAPTAAGVADRTTLQNLGITVNTN